MSIALSLHSTCQPAYLHPPVLPLPFNRHGCSKKLCHPSCTSLTIRCCLSLSTPPNSREEAVQQAKTCLATVLEKHLSNPRLSGNMRKLRQPRFQVEIPVIDDSPASVSQLALDVFHDLSLKKKGSEVTTVILWPSTGLTSNAVEAFQSSYSEKTVENVLVEASTTKENDSILRSADVVVFFAPGTSNLPSIKQVCDRIVPKPVVMFNPEWGMGEMAELGKFKAFALSFDVIYAFAGLAVQGILKTRKGMIFRCSDGGVTRDEKWAVLVEEGGKMKVVSKFKTRPSMDDVSDVLYNVMAVNSPITQSAKFLKQLMSNVTGKK